MNIQSILVTLLQVVVQILLYVYTEIQLRAVSWCLQQQKMDFTKKGYKTATVIHVIVNGVFSPQETDGLPNLQAVNFKVILC